MSKILDLYKGRPLELKTDGNVRGMVPSLAVEGDRPTLEWHGAMLPSKLYLQTVAFARWCNEEYGGEVQGRLYYSEKKKKWKTCILPQYTSRSLTSEEIEGHEDRGKSMRHVEDGDWVQNGTWHSHAACGAGQSSVDEKDELRQPGLHYTVGSMNAKESSIHCRFVFRKLLYNVDAESVIKNPIVDPMSCTSFPDEWKDSLHKDTRVKPQVRLSGYPTVTRGWPAGDTYERFGYAKPHIETKTGEYTLEDYLASESRENIGLIKAFSHLAKLIAGSDDLAESVGLIDEILNDIDAVPSLSDEEELYLFDNEQYSNGCDFY